jgi:hypothetical protein
LLSLALGLTLLTLVLLALLRLARQCDRSPLGSVDFVEPNFCERSLEIRAVVAQNRWAISPSE